jgi:hypothetical protein
MAHYHNSYVKGPAELRHDGICRDDGGFRICRPTVTRARPLLTSNVAPNERTPV